MKTLSELVRDQLVAEGPKDLPYPKAYAESYIQNMTQLELLDMVSNAIEERLAQKALPDAHTDNVTVTAPKAGHWVGNTWYPYD